MPAYTFSFRSASSADCALLLTMMEKFYDEEHLPFDLEKAKVAIQELLRTPAFGTIFLLLVDDEVIGYLVAIQSFILEFGGRQYFLDEFYIAQGWRGRGFGRRALAAVEEFARQEGSRALRLEVARSNTRAMLMYERAGFEMHDRYTMTKVLR